MYTVYPGAVVRAPTTILMMHPFFSMNERNCSGRFTDLLLISLKAEKEQSTNLYTLAHGSCRRLTSSCVYLHTAPL